MGAVIISELSSLVNVLTVHYCSYIISVVSLQFYLGEKYPEPRIDLLLKVSL